MTVGRAGGDCAAASQAACPCRSFPTAPPGEERAAKRGRLTTPPKPCAALQLRCGVEVKPGSQWSGIFLSFRCRTRATRGECPLTLRPGYRLFLGLECLEDAIPLLLDDIVHDSGPFPVVAFRTGLNVNFVVTSFLPAKFLLTERELHRARGCNSGRKASPHRPR